MEEILPVQSPRGGKVGEARIEFCDAIEVATGTHWSNGAYRVAIESDSKPKPRNKTFIGETAWMDARRYAEDMQLDLRLRAQERM